ncbi:MAG: ABC transporter ATP-binding protein [Patescibacteria group bacterium]
MNYTLNKPSADAPKSSGLRAFKPLLPLLAKEKSDLAIAFVAILFNSGSTLVAPIVIGYTVDHYIQTRDFHGVLVASLVLLAIFLVGMVAGYTQTIRMGSVGRRVLYGFRNEIFLKLQELPVAFFNQNKVGDLISRINNDTDRLNQFFAQALMQFVGNFFLILGAGILLLTFNIRLGAASLLPALGVLVVTRLLSPWVKKKNVRSLKSLGGISAEIQESLGNFKVIVAFNRLDYFRDKFKEANDENFRASVGAGLANNVFTPIYALASGLGQLIVVAYGIALIAGGDMTVGLLIGFLFYVNGFYMPLRQLASVWSTLQQSLAALDRISEVLSLKSDMAVIPASAPASAAARCPILLFHNVSFRYPEGQDVLKHISFKLECGKTYALVGPTGGGKTTTASLMARLYDPTEGMVELDGRDIRSYAPEERARKVGFILQEPFLFSGTLLDNLFYGHPDFVRASKSERLAALETSGFGDLLASFEKGLDTQVKTSGESISLGQRQLIAFVRAVLRKPDVLILDEATANIDTVTEQLLGKVLERLPAATTKVIIAHRLNTIENADEIFFVNNGQVEPAGSFAHAVEMLMHGKRAT